jgi:hypothetical protein
LLARSGHRATIAMTLTSSALSAVDAHGRLLLTMDGRLGDPGAVKKSQPIAQRTGAQITNAPPQVFT